ncbi:putative carboxypeptidase precursor [Cladochytrium replicatum]|nr:putative carboxypeptidase precursor [Cladochytrium replicatum]
MRATIYLIAAAAAGSVAAAFPLEESHVLSCTLPELLPRGGDIHAALSELGGSYDVWTHTIVGGAQLDVRVPAEGVEKRRLERLLKRECVVKITNEELRRSYEEEQNPSHELVKRQSTDTFFSAYQSTATIKAKLASWASTYPQLAKYTPSIGKTIQGNDIPLLVITNSSVPSSAKKAIWWNGGQHAREWISPSTVMYLAYKLLTTKDVDLNAWEFHITPVQNVDGYEYTRQSSSTRLWRKNRRLNSGGSYGVDLNRNWDEHFGYVGASSSQTDETYRGTAAFSEPETKALSSYILGVSNRYAMIDFHSYGQLILRNWGWTDTLSQNEKILKTLGDGMKSAISGQSGTSYTSEIGAALYPAAGCTDDWSTAKGKMVAYTIELRSTSSFVLATSQIIPTGEEIWAAMKYYVSFLKANPNIPANPVPSS